MWKKSFHPLCTKPSTSLTSSTAGWWGPSPGTMAQGDTCLFIRWMRGFLLNLIRCQCKKHKSLSDFGINDVQLLSVKWWWLAMPGLFGSWGLGWTTSGPRDESRGWSCCGEQKLGSSSCATYNTKQEGKLVWWLWRKAASVVISVGKRGGECVCGETQYLVHGSLVEQSLLPRESLERTFTTKH